MSRVWGTAGQAMAVAIQASEPNRGRRNSTRNRSFPRTKEDRNIRQLGHRSWTLWIPSRALSLYARAKHVQTA